MKMKIPYCKATNISAAEKEYVTKRQQRRKTLYTKRDRFAIGLSIHGPEDETKTKNMGKCGLSVQKTHPA